METAIKSAAAMDHHATNRGIILRFVAALGQELASYIPKVEEQEYGSSGGGGDGIARAGQL